MKRLLLLLLFPLTTFGQIDSVYLFTTGQNVLGDSIILPTEFMRRGAAVPKLLKFGARKAKIQEIMMGMDALYLPQSDVPGGNVSRSLAKLITYQVPISVQVTQAQLDSISKYIKNLTEPPHKPDIIVEIDDKPSPDIKYMLNPTTEYKAGLNERDWTRWVHFENQHWNALHQNKTASFGYIVNGFIQVSFTGYKIEWHAETRVNHGIAAVSVDGGTETMVDLYRNTTLNETSRVYTWVAPTATNAPHIIKIRVTGNKNTAATEFNVSNDYFKIFKRP